MSSGAIAQSRGPGQGPTRPRTARARLDYDPPPVELSIRQATLGLADALGVVVPNDPLVPLVSVAVLAIVLVGAFLLATWKLARFEIRGGD